MSFKRHDVQEYIEYSLGCLDLSKWTNYLTSLSALTIDANIKSKLDNCIESDAYSYFYKSIYSFAQALGNINRNNYNWSIVQLYYACFYAIRADILLSDRCIVRCNGLYIIKNAVGQKFELVRFGKLRGDHQMAIALIKSLKIQRALQDEILDVELEGVDAYSWLMKHRERSNYQVKNFTDPQTDGLFNHVEPYFKNRNIFELLSFYNKSNYTICFDLDHSILSIPFKKIAQVKTKLEARYGFNKLDNIKSNQYVKKMFMDLGLSKEDFKKLIQ